MSGLIGFGIGWIFGCMSGILFCAVMAAAKDDWGDDDDDV